MLVKYLRDESRRKIGVVVALDKNRIGWSILHDLDMEWRGSGGCYELFDEDTAIGKAVRKAERGYDHWAEDFKSKVSTRFGTFPDPWLVEKTFPKLLMVMQELSAMKTRAEKYFKEGYNGN